MPARKKTYYIDRQWTVILSSTIEVEATSVKEACELALEADYDNQEILDGSDGETWIESVECNGKLVSVPDEYAQESVDESRSV